jgi:hypothetical protein
MAWRKKVSGRMLGDRQGGAGDGDGDGDGDDGENGRHDLAFIPSSVTQPASLARSVEPLSCERYGTEIRSDT